MKLTPEQKRGIEERFAVLMSHLQGLIDDEITGWSNQMYKERLARIDADIKACRDEVLTLVERTEAEAEAEAEQ